MDKTNIREDSADIADVIDTVSHGDKIYISYSDGSTIEWGADSGLPLRYIDDTVRGPGS